jgi:tRNA pseudouridine55 synthase
LMSFVSYKRGHAGTLDPMATGLMIIATESDTKKLSQFLKLPKVYEAEILFGTRTDTGDITGKVLETREVSPNTLKAEIIESTLKSMIGVLKIPVPIYSAIKKEGKPLYKYAREGISIDVPLKEMEVKSSRILGVEGNRVRIRFDVGSGTYIRSLAEELARRLGTVATLSNLRRTSVGEYGVENAEKL